MNELTATTEAVWSKLSADLWKFFRKRVADDHTADDLLQETFVRIHRGLAQVAKHENLIGWIYAIARNLVTDYYRRSRDAGASPADSQPAEEPGSGCSGCEAEGWMHELIQQLPDTYREAVRLAEIDELSQNEVALRLGLSHSGAKSRIQRGRVLLKGLLDQCCTFDIDRRGNVIDYEPSVIERLAAIADRE